MFRYSVLLCLFMLLYSTISSPYRTWHREKEEAVQDTRYHDYDEKMVQGLKEVERVEEEDLTEFDIEPQMAIWKAMKQFLQQENNKPKEDKDNLKSERQGEAYLEPQNYRQVHLPQDEKGVSDVYNNGLVNHPKNKERVFQPVSDKGEAVKQHKTSVYLTPEEDKDGLYHGDFRVQVFQVPVIFPKEHPKVNVYSEPEEDKDNLFHS